MTLIDQLTSLQSTFVGSQTRSMDDYLPPSSNRNFWEAIPEAKKSLYRQEGVEALVESFPSLPASLYMRYSRDGDRIAFETPYFRRRILLFRRFMGYCCGEQSSAMLDGIIDALSCICEEWSWVIPASNLPDYNALPHVKPHLVELFAANTSVLLAMVVHSLEQELNSEAFRLVERVKKLCRERVIVPILTRDDHHWMGYHKIGDHGELNNWTPWITENFLHTLFLVASEEQIESGVKRSCDFLKAYLNVLTPDGGCNEGPMYWEHAIGSLYGCLELLDYQSDGAYDLVDDPFLKRACSYLGQVHIGGEYFCNYADSPCKISQLPGALIGRIGTRLNLPTLNEIAKAYEFVQRDPHDHSLFEEAMSAHRELRNLMVPFNSFVEEKNTKEALYKSHLFKDIEVYTLRHKKLFFSCKGGHNYESHNHNDIGSFMLFSEGEPLIVDPGVGDYTRETFNEHRYEIWTMQTQWHNLPLINGNQQFAGRKFHSSRFKSGKNYCSLGLESAYPTELEPKFWNRSYTMNTNKLTLQDEWASLKPVNSIVWNFISLGEPFVEDSYIKISYKGQSLSLSFDSSLFQFSKDFQSIPLQDHKLRSWSVDKIWRSQLTLMAPQHAGQVQFLFEVN